MKKCIVNNTNSTEEEVGSLFLMVLFAKFEDSSLSICIEKSLIQEESRKSGYCEYGGHATRGQHQQCKCKDSFLPFEAVLSWEVEFLS
jgi:hypothetical protein